MMHATSLPLTAPADDLLGLRDDPLYDAYLFEQYGSKIPEVIDQANVGCEQGLPERFLHSAAQAAKGQLDEQLVPYLLTIRRRPYPQYDKLTDDLPTLAAWVLDLLPRFRAFEIKLCTRCGFPRLVFEGEADFCRRPAPGHTTRCANLERERRFREDRRAWRREYQRLHDRLRRGSLSEHDWQAWRAGNTVENWARYEEWQAARATPPTRTKSIPDRTKGPNLPR